MADRLLKILINILTISFVVILQPACGNNDGNAECQLVVKLQNSNGEESLICAEVADTPEKRAIGLMFRLSMAPDTGMLFTYQNVNSSSFWMKNTYIPLDIIWIDSERKIIGIHENATPKDTSSIFPPGPYLYVLEVNAFYSKEHGISVGDKVSW